MVCVYWRFYSYVSLTGLFKEPIIGSLQSKMAEIRHLENRHDVVFFLLRVVRFGWNFADWYRPTDCRLWWCVEMETRCRIPIWRTFGWIQWHVIPEPCIASQGAATWWIHCHDPRATCHIAGCKNSIRHIENRFSPYFTFSFVMPFRLWRAAAFVSSPIHLFYNNCGKWTLFVKKLLSVTFSN